MIYECEDWILYDKTYKHTIETDADTRINYTDIKCQVKEIRVYGTKKQINEISKKYNIDERYDFKVEKPGSYWYNIYKDPKATNKKIEKKLEDYSKLYELNNKKPLIFRIS